VSRIDFKLVWEFCYDRASVQQLLREVGAANASELSISLLRDVVERRDAGALEAALIVCSRFEQVSTHKDLLCTLANEDWHHSQEEIVSGLDGLRDPSLIPTFVRATQWLPEHMAWDDDNRGLALRAIRAIAKIDDPGADQALISLALSEHTGVRALAERKLRERAERAKSARK
jgi:HEAT repeat protein